MPALAFNWTVAEVDEDMRIGRGLGWDGMDMSELKQEGPNEKDWARPNQSKVDAYIYASNGK